MPRDRGTPAFVHAESRDLGSGFGLLAQLGTTDKSFWTAVLYLAALVLFMGIAAAVIAVIRKRLRQKDEASGIGLTLADVRQWQVAGKVSPEEGEELKRAILESLKSQPRRDGSK